MLKTVARYVRRYPRLSRIVLSCIPDWAITIQIDEIGPFQIRLRRNRAFWLRDPIEHEEYPLGVLQSLVRPSDVVYDVGANIGLYTRFLGQHFEAQHVVAFEPMSSNLKQLRVNVDLGEISSRVTVLPYALSEEEGEFELQMDDFQGATAALDTVADDAPVEGRAEIGLSRKERVPGRVLNRSVESYRLQMSQGVEAAEMIVVWGDTRIGKIPTSDRGSTGPISQEKHWTIFSILSTLPQEISDWTSEKSGKVEQHVSKTYTPKMHKEYTVKG